VMLEKAAKYLGGTTRKAGGGWVWFPNNEHLRKAGVSTPPEKVLELMQAVAFPKGSADPQDLDLLRAFAFESEAVLQNLTQLEGFGVTPSKVRDPGDAEKLAPLLKSRGTGGDHQVLSEWIPSYCCDHPLDTCPTGRVLQVNGGTSKAMLACVKQAGVEVREGHSVAGLIMEGTRCVGVEVEANGQRHQLRAGGGVVFATGGFSWNKKLMGAAHGSTGISGTCAAPTCTGDFAEICEEQGIPLSAMDSAWFKQVVVPYRTDRTGVFFLSADSFLVVDRRGKRFASEKDLYQERGLQMLGDSKAERRYVFAVFDARAREKFAGPLKGLGGAIPWLDDDYNGFFKEQNQEALLHGKDAAELEEKIRAKLAEVAAKGDAPFELDPGFSAQLAATVASFNAYARDGRDPEFQRGERVAEWCYHVKRAPDNKFPNKTMMPLDQAGGLYCVIMGPGTLDTKGGPRISPRAAVLGADGQEIPGLYGAGNCVRSPTNQAYFSAGTTIAFATVFGYIAGREAASVSVGTGASRL